MVNYTLVTYPRRSPTSLLDTAADPHHEALHVFRICPAKRVAHSAGTVLFPALLPTYSDSPRSGTDAVSAFPHPSQCPSVCVFVQPGRLTP